MGSDIPGISVEIIEEAFQLLEEQKADVILGPAVDGGYYTVGASYKTKDNISRRVTMCIMYCHFMILL